MIRYTHNLSETLVVEGTEEQIQTWIRDQEIKMMEFQRMLRDRGGVLHGITLDQLVGVTNKIRREELTTGPVNKKALCDHMKQLYFQRKSAKERRSRRLHKPRGEKMDEREDEEDMDTEPDFDGNASVITRKNPKRDDYDEGPGGGAAGGSSASAGGSGGGYGGAGGSGGYGNRGGFNPIRTYAGVTALSRNHEELFISENYHESRRIVREALTAELKTLKKLHALGKLSWKDYDMHPDFYIHEKYKNLPASELPNAKGYLDPGFLGNIALAPPQHALLYALNHKNYLKYQHELLKEREKSMNKAIKIKEKEVYARRVESFGWAVGMVTAAVATRFVYKIARHLMKTLSD